MRVLHLAREAKHAGFVARRRLTRMSAPARDTVRGAVERVRPYRYREGSLPDSFMARTPKVARRDLRPAPTHVFALWTGDNEMSTNRAGALADMRSRLPVTLITPANLADWVRPGSPLHPTYTDLSLVHRADYLRAYLMHHYGGAYLDIKRDYGDVEAAVQRLNGSSEHWMTSFREMGPDTVAPEAGDVGVALRRHYRSLIAMCAFAAKPGSPLTAEWLEEVHHRLDAFAPELSRHPGNALGDNAGYPIPWTGILGGVLHPLCLKYTEHLRFDDEFRPSLANYR